LHRIKIGRLDSMEIAWGPGAGTGF
jgi:hypothetical protein